MNEENIIPLKQPVIQNALEGVTYPQGGTAHKLAQTFLFPSKDKFPPTQLAAAVNDMANGIQIGINLEVEFALAALYKELASTPLETTVTDWLRSKSEAKKKAECPDESKPTG